VIPTAVNGCLNALKASANTPSIKRFVFTSSSIAATMPRPNVEFEINDQSWNDVVIQKGWNHPEDEPAALKGWYLYGALKTETEKAAWKFMKEEDRGFVFNAVVSACSVVR
jgi:nucleoside-diphosphate-sugar epimerase